MNTPQITIVCFLKSKPEMRSATHAELSRLTVLSRSEPGNINYLLHQAKDDENLFIIYENWKDQAALDFHMNQDYVKAFLDKASVRLESPVAGTICRLL